MFIGVECMKQKMLRLSGMVIILLYFLQKDAYDSSSSKSRRDCICPRSSRKDRFPTLAQTGGTFRKYK